MKGLLAVIFLMSVVSLTPSGLAGAGTPVLTGVWESEVLFADIVAHVEHQGEVLTGVVYITKAYGKVDTYHVNGSVKDGLITAAHYRGHRFIGRLQDDGQVSGRVISASGKSIDIIARRKRP